MGFDRKRLTPYSSEFLIRRTEALKTRLRLFCALTLAVYIVISVFYLVINKEEFKSSEIFFCAFLMAAAAAVLFANRRVKTLPAARVNSLFFAIALLVTFTGLFVIYPEFVAESGASILAICLFFIAFAMPWDISDTALIGILHISAYIFLHQRSKIFASNTAIPKFTPADYTDGIVLLSVAFILCLVIRKRDNDLDKENFILLKELEEKNRQMERELALARDVHKTLIPKSTETDRVNIAVNYVPVSSVGGDYATFHATKEGDLFFLIGDITGHGVPAALLVNRIYGEVESLSMQNYTPGPLLKELDRFVQEHFRQTQMYLSVCSGLLDFKRKVLFYSNYGHPPQILLKRPDNRIYRLEPQTHLLGLDLGSMDKDAGRIFEGSLTFEPKDRIILFTDGLTETMGEGGELYGLERLESFVKSSSHLLPVRLNNDLLAELNSFRKGPASDDIFLMTIDIK